MRAALLAACLCAAAARAAEPVPSCADAPWVQAAPPTTFENDLYGTLKAYLGRARASLALSTPSLSGFATLTDAEAARIPGTLKSEGLAFDGAFPIFSWRYGLQLTDARYRPLVTRALAIPPDILAAHYDAAKRNGFSHIGDVDAAGGRLYAPIEDEDHRTKPFVAVFDARTLRYTGEKHELPVSVLPHGVPWIAVDAPSGAFYTMDWDSPDLLMFDLKTYALVKKVAVKDATTPGHPIMRVQGAKVRGGRLYLASDSDDEVPGPGGAKLKRKRIYALDPASGEARELAHFDEPDRAEMEGLAFGPDGILHVLVLAPYFYDARFPPEMEINDDDWNPSARLLHLRPAYCR
jgi:hypothetical protein